VCFSSARGGAFVLSPRRVDIIYSGAEFDGEAATSSFDAISGDPKIPPANLDEAFLPTSYALNARHNKVFLDSVCVRLTNVREKRSHDQLLSQTKKKGERDSTAQKPWASPAVAASVLGSVGNEWEPTENERRG
jgi:hypothetical protein